MTAGDDPGRSGAMRMGDLQPDPDRSSTDRDEDALDWMLRQGLEARLLQAVEQAVIATDTSGKILFWNRLRSSCTAGRPVRSWAAT